MNLTRWSGKRRRSASGSDSFSGSGGDSSDSPLLLSRPVLSPPPGLRRSLKDRGRPPARAAGTPRHSVGSGRGGQLTRAPRREVSSPRGARAFARPARLLLPFLSLWLGPGAARHFLLTWKSFQSIFSDCLVVIFKWFLGLFDLYLQKQLASWPNLITCREFTPNSVQCSLQILILSGCTLSSLFTTHRNPKTQWKANYWSLMLELNSTIAFFSFFS